VFIFLSGNIGLIMACPDEIAGVAGGSFGFATLMRSLTLIRISTRPGAFYNVVAQGKPSNRCAIAVATC